MMKFWNECKERNRGRPDKVFKDVKHTYPLHGHVGKIVSRVCGQAHGIVLSHHGSIVINSNEIKWSLHLFRFIICENRNSFATIFLHYFRVVTVYQGMHNPNAQRNEAKVSMCLKKITRFKFNLSAIPFLLSNLIIKIFFRHKKVNLYTNTIAKHTTYLVKLC